MRQGPLAGRYPAAAAMVIFALVPYLGLSAALQPLTPIIGGDLHMSPQTMSLGLGLANAGYAVGTVLAVQFAQLLPQRRMMVLYAALLVLGSVLAASASSSAMFITGHVLQGLCTSLLLIAAVPPLALGFGIEKFRWTAMIMNVCIFGAVALGPVVGGIQANAEGWRPLFWIVAGISLAALVLSVLTFEDAPPADLSAPRDVRAIGLAAAGCVSAFYGASQLLTHPFVGPQTLLPLLVGLGLIVTLVVYQYRSRHPLLTVRTMLTSTIPVAGIVLALAAAAASVSATVLTAAELYGSYSPLHVGLLYLPELGGALITAVALGLVLKTRELHYLPLAGMAFLAAGIGVFLIHIPATEATALIGSGLTGNRSRRRGRTRAVRRRLLAGGREPAARVRDRRAVPGCRGVHDRADLRALRCHGRRQPPGRHAARAVDRTCARPRRRARSGRALRPRWSARPDARHPAVHGRRGPGLVLAAAAGVGPPAPARARARRGGGLMGGGETALGPVVFAYDGSDLARLAIDDAAEQLGAGREAIALTVWQPFDVGFVPPVAIEVNAAEIRGVRQAAELTAAEGASLARDAGFEARSAAIERAPAWKAIVEYADEHDASLIVLGSHGRTGLGSVLIGSVAEAVAAHSRRSVLIVHRGD